MLFNVQVMSLSANRLYELPPLIEDLTSLEVLTVSDNLLETLPSKIGNFRGLTQLAVSNNQVSLPCPMNHQFQSFIAKRCNPLVQRPCKVLLT